MGLRKIEEAVRANAKSGSWITFFRRQGVGWQCILFPRLLLSDADYETLSNRLSAPRALTRADRKRNGLRARADRAGGDYV
jgi:hypothetical protein